MGGMSERDKAMAIVVEALSAVGDPDSPDHAFADWLEDRLASRIATYGEVEYRRGVEAAAEVALVAVAAAVVAGEAAKSSPAGQWLDGAQSQVVATFAHIAQACDEIAKKIALLAPPPEPSRE